MNVSCEMIEPIDVSVIIVSNNHRQYLGRCLTSLARQIDQLKTEIFVVDNFSIDNSAEFVRENFPEVHLFAEHKKRGFSANNNIAIRHSRGRYVLLLNPDTEATPTALKKLVCFMDNHQQIGICGPQLRFPDGSVQPSCRAFPTWQTVLARRTPLRSFLKKTSLNERHLLMDIDHDQTQAVDWLLGACLMIRKDMLDQVGLLDEHYFLYVEDIDLCLRAYQNGWSVYYYPEAVVIHHHLAVSDSKLLSKHMYYHTLSMVYFGLKYKLPEQLSFLRPVGQSLIDLLPPKKS